MSDPMTVPAKPALVVRLSHTDYVGVAQAAERDGRTMAGFVRNIVRQHLASVS